ncbi:ROK family transcriptional regulator [Cellulomonas chitinilytica]|uniref:ROK family transcriptional regulator n=1 Tax=Cellulomonas chitinilytica TaxID=398759 RepID=UPI0019409FEF|nr:ROK family transcriptional regulator [Cellulomonas chitinilytica]
MTEVREEAYAWPRRPAASRDVLLELLVHGAMPRSELAERLGLSRPTMTRLTRGLVEAGVLVEAETELRTALGRPSELLRVVPAAGHFVGVKLTGDHLYGVVTDLTASVVGTLDEPLTSTDVTSVLAQVADAVERLRRRHRRVMALGLTLAGTLRRDAGPAVVVESMFLRWADVPLEQLLVDATGLPSVVENDVQALTAAEHWFGAGAGLDSLAVVTVGAGIGCGLVVHGRLVRGAHGLPGQLGHVLVDPSGPVCDQGHRGCAAAYLMTAALLDHLTTPEGRPTFDEALARARAGDPAAVEVVDRAGYALGVVVGTVANVVDPQKVLLTGEGLPLHEVAAARFRDGLAATYASDPDRLVIDVQPFDFGEWARSAAALAIRSVVQGTA